MSEAETLLIFILVLGVIVFFASVKICAQYQRAVVFFLGRYARTSGPGLFLLLPFVEWRSTVDIRTTSTSVEQQETITKDNVPVKINAVIWRRVVDPERSLIEVANVSNSVTQAAVTALRAPIGQHTLDEVLKDQDSIAGELQNKLELGHRTLGREGRAGADEEYRDPGTMQRAMAQEAEALREKRARQIKAVAELEAAKLLKQAADIIATSPASLELRRMQMLTEVGAEQNTMTIVMMPSEFVDLARTFAQKNLAG